MGKMKETIVTDYLDVLDFDDMKKRMRWMLFSLIVREYPGEGKNKDSLIRAYNTMSKKDGGLLLACKIGRNMLAADGETWAYHAWRRTVGQFLNLLETDELKADARKAMATL